MNKDTVRNKISWNGGSLKPAALSTSLDGGRGREGC